MPVDHVVVKAGRSAVTSTLAAFCSIDEPCSWVSVAAPAATGPASSNTDGIEVGNKDDGTWVLDKINYEGFDVPVSKSGDAFAKRIGSSNQVIKWAVIQRRG